MRPRIDKNTVLRYLGYSGQAIDDNLMSRIDSLIHQCEDNEDAKSVARYFDITKNTGDLVLLKDSSLELKGKDVSRHLTGCVGCILFACTLGTQVNTNITTLNAMSVLDGVIYNAAASDLIDQASNVEHKRLSDDFRAQGLILGRRYSPGYGDFPIDCQGALLRELMASKKIGLFVTRAGMLAPTKSITAVIGVRKGNALGSVGAGVEGDARGAVGAGVEGEVRGAVGAGVEDDATVPRNSHDKAGVSVERSSCKSCAANKSCTFLKNGNFCN